MKSVTHITTGALSALVAYKLNISHEPIELVAGAILASTLPDIDQHIKIIRHRGPTHSIIFPIALYILSMYYTKALLFGACLGWLSHLIIDLFNGKGIEIIWPLSDKNYRIMDIKYNGIMENVMLVGMVIGIGLIIASFYVQIDIKMIGAVIR